jgi:hypothetical protein
MEDTFVREEPGMKRRTALWTLIAAVVSMAGTASPAPGQGAESARTPDLVAHWRSTRIVFESPRDEHLVLQADGSAETWTVTASGRSASVKGTWGSEGRTLTIDWENGQKWARPFTFYEGQLVFPNVPKQRKFWDRLR